MYEPLNPLTPDPNNSNPNPNPNPDPNVSPYQSPTDPNADPNPPLHSFAPHMQGHSDWVGTVSFNPDGSVLASGSGDTTIKLWSVPDGQFIKTLTVSTVIPGWCVCVCACV